MNIPTSFSDRFLIQAASQYVYEMSFSNVYKDSVFTVAMNLKKDYQDRYIIERFESKAFNRDDHRIDIRYIVFKDTKTNEYALVFQGSDGSISNLFSGEDNDWSNNLSNAAHLGFPNYKLAKEEYEYLSKTYNVTAISGNSLGRAYALFIAHNYADLRAIGLNAAPRVFGTHYKINKNATLLLTSTDILSRGVSLDLSRLKNDDLEYQKKIETAVRIKEAYGIEPYIVKRSIPYSNMLNIMVGHVTSMRNYRDKMMDLYNDNFIFYNARIIKKHKEWKKFSKYLLQKTYKELDQSDYRFFTEKYIYPSLSEADRGIVDTYKSYPQLEDFMVFDLKTNNIMDSNGKCLLHDNYAIDDSYDFVNNMELINSKYTKTREFLLFNSFFELKSVFEDEGFTFIKKKFISPSLKLSLDWDWMFAKMFIDMPLPVKLKTGEFLEQNLSFVYRVNNNLSSDYDMASHFSKKDVENYVNDLMQVVNRLINLHEEYTVLYNNMISTIEMMLYVNDHKLREDQSLYTVSGSYKKINIDDLNHLDLQMMERQLELAEKSIKSNKGFVEEGIVDLAKSLESVMQVILDGLKSQLDESSDPKTLKLYTQIDALIKNVDLPSFLQMVLSEFEDDIIAYLLRGSVALNVYYNFKQMSESNEMFLTHLMNLDLYMKKNLKESQYTLFSKHKTLIEQLVNSEQDIIKKIIQIK